MVYRKIKDYKRGQSVICLFVCLFVFTITEQQFRERYLLTFSAIPCTVFSRLNVPGLTDQAFMDFCSLFEPEVY